MLVQHNPPRPGHPQRACRRGHISCNNACRCTPRSRRLAPKVRHLILAGTGIRSVQVVLGVQVGLHARDFCARQRGAIDEDLGEVDVAVTSA